MFCLFLLRKLKKQKIEEGQIERELVSEEMVRKYLIIVTRNEPILYKNNIFNRKQ